MDRNQQKEKKPKADETTKDIRTNKPAGEESSDESQAEESEGSSITDISIVLLIITDNVTQSFVQINSSQAQIRTELQEIRETSESNGRKDAPDRQNEQRQATAERNAERNAEREQEERRREAIRKNERNTRSEEIAELKRERAEELQLVRQQTDALKELIRNLQRERGLPQEAIRERFQNAVKTHQREEEHDLPTTEVEKATVTQQIYERIIDGFEQE